jgi:phospholipase/carboxylesterase
MKRARVANLDVVLAGGDDRQGGGNGPMLVLLHGYGAPGDDLVPLARQLVVPSNVRFAFPAAPLALEMGGSSARAWWELDMVELQRAVMLGDFETLKTRVPAGLSAARGALTELLDVLESEHGARREQLVLGGFSQGAMLATDWTLRAERPPAALVIMSGSLICRDEWLPLMKARAGLPVLQSHGRADPVLSYELAEELRLALTAAGAPVEHVPFSGGHGIPNGVVEALSALIARVTK